MSIVTEIFGNTLWMKTNSYSSFTTRISRKKKNPRKSKMKIFSPTQLLYKKSRNFRRKQQI